MKIFKKALFLMILSIVASAHQIEPVAKFDASGAVMDIIISGNILYAGTDKGSVDIFDLKTHELSKRIKLHKIEDFLGEKYPPKIFSVDLSPDRKKVLILSEAPGGTRELLMYENGHFDVLISSEERMYIKKAKFADSGTIFLALLGNEVYFSIYRKRKLSIESSFHSRVFQISLLMKTEKER